MKGNLKYRYNIEPGWFSENLVNWSNGVVEYCRVVSRFLSNTPTLQYSSALLYSGTPIALHLKNKK
jgi:hypothetical protein